jgi:hypothetical protein
MSGITSRLTERCKRGSGSKSPLCRLAAIPRGVNMCPLAASQTPAQIAAQTIRLGSEGPEAPDQQQAQAGQGGPSNWEDGPPPDRYPIKSLAPSPPEAAASMASNM